MKFPSFIIFLMGVFLAIPIHAQELQEDTIQNDSISQKRTKEAVVYGIASNHFAFPLLVMNKNTFQSATFFTPADAMKMEPGIAMLRDGIWATSVNIRGLSEPRLLFLIDDNRIFTTTGMAAALSTVDLNSIEKIEIIKGAGSALFGSGALGGVVNFITERPTYTSSFQVKGKVGSGLHTVNNLWNNDAKIDLTNENWYLSLKGSYRAAQNIQTPTGKLPNSQFNDVSWGVQGGMSYVSNQELLFNYQHFEAWDIGLLERKTFLDTAMVRYKNVKRNLFSAEYVFSDVGDYLKEVRLKAYTQNFDHDIENIVNASTVILPSSLNSTWGLKAVSNWRFTEYNKLIFGAESWLHDTKTIRKKITRGDSITTVVGEQPTPDTEMFDAGIFGQYRWEFSPHYWVLNAGLRLDYLQISNDTAFQPVYRYTYSNSLPSEQKYVANLPRMILYEAGKHRNFSYAAQVDLTYYPTSIQKFTFSLSNSYRMASIEELFKYIDQQSGIIRVGNPSLKPEKGIFTNLSYALDNHRFFLKTDVFINYLFDLITEKKGTFTYINSNGIIENREAYINTNINKAILYGFEIDANWKINSFLSTQGNLSCTFGKDIKEDEWLPQIPPLKGILTLNYMQKNLFEISLSAIGAAKQSKVAPEEQPTNGHVIFNANIHSAKISVGKANYFQLLVGANNILNTSYHDHLDATRGLICLEPGRDIYFKLNYGW